MVALLFAVPVTDPVILALIVGLAVALVRCAQIAEQTKSLKTQNASLSRQVETLKDGKTAHDELLQAWADKISARLEDLSPDDLAQLDGVLRAKLPQAVEAALAQPSGACLNALRAKLEPHAETMVATALKSPNSELGQALLERLQRVLANAEHPSWARVLETLADPLFERVARLAENPPPALATQIDQKIGEALEEQIHHICQNPDDYQEIADTINEALGNRIAGLAEHLPAEASTQIDKKIGEALVAKIDDVFADPEQYEEVCGGVNEALGNRITALAENPADELAARIDQRSGDRLVDGVDHLFENAGDHEDLFASLDEALGRRILDQAENPPAPIAARIDQRIGDQLVDGVDDLFENAGDHEDLFASLDEALGRRILDQAENPPAPIAARIDQRIGDQLVDGVKAIFNNLSDHSGLEEEMNGRLSRRIEQRLQEEAGNGSESRLEKALDELLHGHLARRFQQTNLAGLDRTIDERLKAAVDRPSQEMLALVDRLFEARLLAQARDRLGDNIKECDADLEAAMLRRLQARIRAFPQEGSTAVDELIDLKLPGWFQDQLGDSFQVNQSVARQVALRVEGWIGSALEQPKPLLKNALENWLTQQVLSALKASPLGADTNNL